VQGSKPQFYFSMDGTNTYGLFRSARPGRAGYDWYVSRRGRRAERPAGVYQFSRTEFESRTVGEGLREI